MNNQMEYKKYLGTVEFSESDGVFYGKVSGISALISYEGTTVNELVDDFHNAVDDYLALCKAENREPEISYKGSFNVRISPELHRRAAIYASQQGISLNKVVERSLRTTLMKKRK